ncbi:MAG: hypothetical protein M3256_00435 [Actinomycetota bacterium]|nr:hypothetical protein [Actinomycetota bacterium]
MWKVDRPQMSARATYQKCVAVVRDPVLKARLLQIEDDIADASDEFTVAAMATMLSTLPAATHVRGVTAAELTDIYTIRFAKLRSVGRPMYDQLLLAPVHARCPLCGHRLVTTLDHHLPKSRFPALAVAPLNLVPACTDCNKIKLECVAQSRAEELLHPYFDDIETAQWLYAAVVPADPAAVVFYADPPIAWDSLLRDRIIYHFDKFALARLYAAQAAVELQNIKFQLAGLLSEAGAAGVAAHLGDQAETRRHAYVNSWQTAFYGALAQSDWFATGGF